MSGPVRDVDVAGPTDASDALDRDERIEAPAPPWLRA